MKFDGGSIARAFCMAAVVFLAGCSSGPVSGTYVGKNGQFSLEFQSGGNAVLHSGSVSEEEKYTVEGNKVTLSQGSFSDVLTIKPDGSLEGKLGTLTKK